MVDGLPVATATRPTKEDGVPCFALRVRVFLVPQGRLGSAVHAVGDSQARSEEIAPRDLAYRPADQTGAVEANLAVLVGRLVAAGTGAGASSPSVFQDHRLLADVGMPDSKG